MNFCPGSKNSIIGKTQRKPQDMTELSTNYVALQSFIDKNWVDVSQISFIEPIASFHEIQNITKMSFNIPLRKDKRKYLSISRFF